MRGVNGREARILMLSLPGNADIVLPDPEDHAAMDALYARGLLLPDAGETYWTTPIGRIVLLASLSGGQSDG